MALGTHDLAQLALSKPDGSGLSRIEAEKELWEKCKIVHNMRLLAAYHFGLENRFALGMTPTSVIHWVLDEMIRKRMIAGEQVGVQPELESDTSYFNTYIQRLRVFVENGQALMPKEGEGIDMDNFQQPPQGFAPPPQQNGQQVPQQGFVPPPPPPVGYPAPGQQMAPPPQQFAPPPQQPQNMPGYGPPPQQAQPFAQPPMPPQQPQQFGAPPQQGFAPPPQQQGFGPPPQQPGFPPQGAPPQMPQQGAPPTPPATSPSNRRRGKSEGAPQAAPPPQGMPQQQQMGFPAPGAAAPTFGAPPQMPGFGPPNGVQQPQAAPQQAAPASGEIQALRGEVAALTKLVQEQMAQLLTYSKRADQALSIVMRPYYQKEMPQNASQLTTEATFKEIGLPVPQ